MGSQQFCLKWNNHQLNMLTVFDQLLQNEAFVDVTIACEGLSLKAHKMVLSACSPYFQNLFMDNPCKHPIVILKDIRYDEMKAIIDFMYKGEVNVSQDQLSALLKTAEALKVKGLAEVTGQGPHGQVQQSNSQSSVLFETVGSRHSPPAKRKKRPPASAPVSIGSPVSPGNSNTSHSTSSHRALSPPHPVVQSAVSLAPVASVGSSATTSGMCSGDEEQTPLMGLNRSRNIEGVPGSSKDSLSNVKEEKIEMEEPPDEVEDLIMEATPEHIEIEPSTTDTGFNGSTQDQSQLANIKYGNMFNPQPSTSGTSPGSMQMTTRSRNVHVTLQSSLNTTTLSNFPSELDHQNSLADEHGFYLAHSLSGFLESGQRKWLPMGVTAIGGEPAAGPRGRRKLWERRREFPSKDAAEEFLAEEKSWALQFTNSTKTGIKKYYRCNKLRKGGCHATLCLFYHADSDVVTLLATQDSHSHS